MSEQQQPGGDRPVPARVRRGGSHPLRWMGLLLLAAAAGYGLWYGWQWGRDAFDAVSTQQELLARQARELAALRSQAEELSSRQTDLSAAVRRNGTDIAALDGRIEDGQEALARLGDTVEGGRTRLELAAVEQLLLLANDRLLLAQDAATARTALDLADRRIASLNDPQLFRVREALARERAALATLAVTDRTGLSLSLSTIAGRLAELPLRARTPGRFEAAGDGDLVEVPPEAGTVARVWAAVRTALAGMFSLRRSDAPPPRLLAPEEEALVVQILRLKVDGARLALLAGDTRAFRELAGEAAGWLALYYDAADTGVRATRAELERMAALELEAELPDISRSLALLRAHLGASPR